MTQFPLNRNNKHAICFNNSNLNNSNKKWKRLLRQRNFMYITGGVTFLLLLFHYVSLEHGQQHRQKSYLPVQQESRLGLGSSSGVGGVGGGGEMEEEGLENLFYNGGVVDGGSTLDTTDPYANGALGSAGAGQYLMTSPNDEEEPKGEIERMQENNEGTASSASATLEVVTATAAEEEEEGLTENTLDKGQEENSMDNMIMPESPPQLSSSLQNNDENEAVHLKELSSPYLIGSANNKIPAEEFPEQQIPINEATVETVTPSEEIKIMEGTVPMKYYIEEFPEQLQHPQQHPPFTVADLPYIHCQSSSSSTTTINDSSPKAAEEIILVGYGEQTSAASWRDSGILHNLCSSSGSNNDVHLKVTAVDLNGFVLKSQPSGVELYNVYEALLHGNLLTPNNNENGDGKVIIITAFQSGNAIIDLAEEEEANNTPRETQLKPNTYDTNHNQHVHSHKLYLTQFLKAWITIGNVPKVRTSPPSTLERIFHHHAIPVLSIIGTNDKEHVHISDTLVSYGNAQGVEIRGNHACHLENPLDFVRVVLDFVMERVVLK